MPVIGVGIDVVDIDRFVQSLERTPSLRARLFTDHEASRPPASLAARFAAKEAIAKALGAPVGMAWHDAEIVSSETISASRTSTSRCPTTRASPRPSWSWSPRPCCAPTTSRTYAVRRPPRWRSCPTAP